MIYYSQVKLCKIVIIYDLCAWYLIASVVTPSISFALLHVFSHSLCVCMFVSGVNELGSAIECFVLVLVLLLWLVLVLMCTCRMTSGSLPAGAS